MLVKMRFTVLSLCVIAALLVGAWQPVLAQEAPDEPTPQGIRYDAPPYAVDGPYGVGVRYFTIPAAAENDRELTATVWYPAEPPEGDTPQMIYEQQFEPGEFPPFSVLGDAQLDAPPDASGAPYPLVVYSHAHWSMGQEVPYFVEHLASRGFVVISVDHEDNWSTDMGPMAYQTMIRRPQEVTRQIDFAEQLSAPDGDLAGLIATDKVGVGGWSMGGITSMSLAGARMDLAGLRAWCEANPALVEANSFACVDMLDHEAEMAEFAGLDAIPIGLWPATQDDRIAAAVRLSGSLFMYGSEGMAAVDVPVMLFHGGGEAIADPGLQVGDPYTSVAAPRKAEVVLDHAGHLVFNSSCEDNPDMAAMGFPMFCTDPVWDMDRAHDLINHFATAFLLAELKGDTEAAAALAPENVSFPGIEYQAEGYAPAAASFQPESGYADVNGTRLYYEMAGEGEPVVMIHGFGWDTRDWDYQFAELAKDYQVMRYDLRGFGKSAMPTEEPYAHADDLKALLDYLGIESAHVFGHSFGGELAINFALAYPEAVRSLVLIEPDIQGAQGLPPLTPEEEASFAAVAAALEQGDRAGAALAIVDLHPLVTIAKDVPGVRELVQAAFTDYTWFHFLNADPVVQPEIPAAERIEEITVPTLLVVGDSTTEFQKIEVDRLAETLPDAEKVVFENSDHFPHVLYPEQFNALVLDFLAAAGGQ